MFTLKLYRRKGPNSKQRSTLTIAAHHVVVHEIGEGKDGRFQALELHAFESNENDNYEVYYVGTPEPGMEAHGRDDLHLDIGPRSWWGWGLLENWEGNTSEHYRPASYG